MSNIEMQIVDQKIRRWQDRLWKRITQLCMFFLLTLLITSCKKWLDEKPDTNLSTPETLNDLQALLDNGLFINFISTPSSLEAVSDDYFLTQAVIDQGRTDIPLYYWHPYIASSSNDWRWAYIPIYNVNICLESLKKIPETAVNSVQWRTVKGSALFIRSYFFLELLWTYSKTYDPATASSDLGIALRLDPDFNIPSVRATVQQCYEQVIADTKEAISYLPDLPIHPLRPSKAAAYGLLARAYLSMRDYANALKYGDLALQLNSQLIDYNGDGDLVAAFNSSVSPFRRFNKETIYYTEQNLNHPIGSPAYAKLDTILYQEYSVNDLRRTAFFRADGAYQVFKGTYAQSTDYLFSGIATDEMYLIKAECLSRIGNGGVGDKDSAMTILNSLLTKRWVSGTYSPPVVSTANQALDIILKERRKELIFRGLRWPDIKRLNKEGFAITPKRIVNGTTYTLPPNDNRYALPLPQDIINITGMPQNPGW